MKKVLILSVLLMLGLFSSCSDNDDSRFNKDSQSGWVQFQNSTSINTMFVSGETISIPVVLKAPVNTSGLEVIYSITNVVGNATDVISADYEVSFDKATSTSNIVLTMLGTSLPNTVEFDLTLTSVSRPNVTVGIVDGAVNLKPIVKRIKICSNEYTTNYSGASTATIAGAPTYDGWSPIMTPVSGSSNSFQFNTLWGSGLVPLLTGDPSTNVFLYPGILTINSNNTVTIVGINAPTSPNRYPGGVGTYDPCTKVIKYRLNQGLFTNPFQVDVVLTPN